MTRSLMPPSLKRPRVTLQSRWLSLTVKAVETLTVRRWRDGLKTDGTRGLHVHCTARFHLVLFFLFPMYPFFLSLTISSLIGLCAFFPKRIADCSTRLGQLQRTISMHEATQEPPQAVQEDFPYFSFVFSLPFILVCDASRQTYGLLCVRNSRFSHF